jgi:hypothetical protein
MTPCPRCEAAAKVCDSLAEADAQYGRDAYYHRRNEAELCARRIRTACAAAGHAEKDAEIVSAWRSVRGGASIVRAGDRLAAHIEGEKP